MFRPLTFIMGQLTVLLAHLWYPIRFLWRTFVWREVCVISGRIQWRTCVSPEEHLLWFQVCVAHFCQLVCPSKWSLSYRLACTVAVRVLARKTRTKTCERRGSGRSSFHVRPWAKCVRLRSSMSFLRVCVYVCHSCLFVWLDTHTRGGGDLTSARLFSSWAERSHDSARLELEILASCSICFLSLTQVYWRMAGMRFVLASSERPPD